MDDYDLMADLKEWAESYDAIEIGADGVFHNAIDRIEAQDAEMKLVMEINERLLAALRKINSRLSDDDSWLAQSIDCRNIADAALEKKNGNQHD